MVWHGNKRFTAQAQPLFFHCGGNHFVSFTRANHMGQQGVVAVQDVGNGIALVRPQRDFRVHPEKLNVTSIIFARANTIKFFIVQRHQTFTALTVLENPVFKSIFYHPLLGLCFFGGRTIELMLLLAVFVIDCIVNFGGSQVECVLQQMIAVDTFCAVGVRDADIIVALALVGNIPVIQIFIVTDSYFLFAVG